MADRIGPGPFVIVDPDGPLAQMAKDAGVDLPTREPNTYVLLDDDAQQCRTISEDEFYASYVDQNIETFQLDDVNWLTLDVDNHYVTLNYSNGAQTVVLLGSIDYNSGKQVEQYAKRNGIIYPIDESGRVQFDATNTPGLVAIRTAYWREAKRLNDCRIEMARIVYVFTGAIKNLGHGPEAFGDALVNATKNAWEGGDPCREAATQ